MSDAVAERHRDLLRHIAAGEAHALGQLYELTFDQVYGLCLRMLGNFADADEAVADTYLQVWQKPTRHDMTRGSVIAWMLVIARSRSIDLQRRQQGHRRYGEQLADEELAYIAYEQPPAEDLVDALQQRARIRLVLAQIPHAQRTLIELAFDHDLSHQEISDRLELPLGTVKSRLRRGIAAMRQTFAEEGWQLSS